MAQALNKKSRIIEFSLHAPDAERVSLAGNFNNWSQKADPMKNGAGTWKKRIKLETGMYEYKFVVDGEWMLDPRCERIVKNELGGINCIIEV